MKINSINNFISFKKQLVATGAYLSNGESRPCFFYQLKGEEDKLYLNNILQEKEWKETELADDLADNLIKFANDEYYSIEDFSGNCLGVTEIYNEKFKGKESKKIHIIETCPTLSAKNKERKEKYIGESLLAFIVKLCKRENKEMIYVPVVYETARDFYKSKCHFEEKIREDEMEDLPVFLMKKDFDNLIIQNENHTQEQIEFV